MKKDIKDKVKIAFVKQVVYPDLYVCKNGTPPKELLFSSAGRVGPFGLFSRLGADFIIVEEDNAKECHMWEYDNSADVAKYFRQLKTKKLNEIKGQEFKIPGSNICQGELAVSVEDVNWEKYNIVISINISIPSRIIEHYPEILWCHMSGEAGKLQDKAYFGYDLSLVQLSRGEYDSKNKVLEFPYTFIGADDLERVMGSENAIVKSGIYGEVSCVKERPVTHIPQFEVISRETGEQVKYHKQRIEDNLNEIYYSKYFLKVGGRKTRGNGAIESISLGTPVLMSPLDIIHKQIIPREAWVFNQNEAIDKINYYNNDDSAYRELLRKERELVQLFAYDYPLFGLLKAYTDKNRLKNSLEIE